MSTRSEGRRSANILLVEDNEADVILTQEAFRETGYDVTLCCRKSSPTVCCARYSW